MAVLGSEKIAIHLLLICIVALSTVDAAARPLFPWRKLSALVQEEPLVLQYHNGPLLTTTPILNLHLIWYGNFTSAQRAIVGDFVQSLGTENGKQSSPSVFSWWKTTEAYRGSAPSQLNQAQPLTRRLGKQKLDEAYSLGKSLKRTDIAVLVKNAIQSGALLLPEKKKSNGEVELYLVLTSEDVLVENFCSSSCGFHGSDKADIEYAYAWVGNSVTQCPGQCAWPFHQPIYGPQSPPLLPPNGDVGIDGMIINIATTIAGAVTNPFKSGYFQGDAAAPLEAVSACPGMYGSGAYPGYAGQVFVDETTGASYNAHGLNGRTFLLPAMWDPTSRSCKTLV
ncbi:hypothetical protein SUGI_1141850 [Cryptomeria japonica]|uniref:protein EXORDIUM-like 2 n=1 Tax=Cryptomeria japonica TaxID=3369 RepID=UPI0024146C8C|nr:protein EXORDIUM-like 2 [Cryptomeria japonica]GLJ53513.1 hypothetical protein SUGI_1141850 [Cryptomeria japonica]